MIKENDRKVRRRKEKGRIYLVSFYLFSLLCVKYRVGFWGYR